MFDKAAVDHVKSSIRKVTSRAAWISTQICRYTIADLARLSPDLGDSEAVTRAHRFGWTVPKDWLCIHASW